MDWSQIVTSFAGLAVSAIAWALQKYLSLKMSDEHRKQAAWAIEQGVAAAAARMWQQPGEERQHAAIKTAESLAPKAMATLTHEQKRVVTDATYARMRSSLPHATEFSLRQSQLPHAIEDLGSKPPPKEPLP
jgi:hypothetical protein